MYFGIAGAGLDEPAFFGRVVKFLILPFASGVEGDAFAGALGIGAFFTGVGALKEDIVELVGEMKEEQQSV